MKHLIVGMFFVLSILGIFILSMFAHAEPTFNSNFTFQSLNSTNLNTFNYCAVCSYNFQINVTNAMNATFQLGSTNYTESGGGFLALIPFNEGSGNSSADITGSGLYNMSLFQGFNWDSGANCTWGNYQSGSCVRFDGISGYGTINNTQWLSNSSNFTVVLDLNTLTPSIDLERILDMVESNATNGWQFIWASPNTLQFVGRNGTGGVFNTFTLTSSTNILNDTKYFVALEYNKYNGSAFMWIDGTRKDAFFTTDSIIVSTLTNLTIAKRAIAQLDFANVTIDNLRIYNYSLTDSQVRNLYEAEHGGGSKGIVYSIYDGSNSSTKYINFSSQPAGTIPIIWYAINNTNGQNSTNMGNLTINPIVSPLSIQINSTSSTYGSQDWTNNFIYLNFTATTPLIWTGYRNNTLTENTTGLVLRFPFDEGSGVTTMSAEGNNIIGYVKGNATWSSDAKLGKGINTASGLLSRVTVNIKQLYNESNLDTYTWNIWVKFNGTQPDILPRIIDKNDYDLVGEWIPGHFRYGTVATEFKNSTGSPFTFYFDSMNFSQPQNQNNWHMLTVVFDNNVVGCVMNSFQYPVPMRGFIDGVQSNITYVTQVAGACQFGNSTSSKLFDSTTRNFTFGGKDSPSREWNGTIDEVRIYTRNLTDDEVWNLYLEGAAKLGVGTYNYTLNTTGSQNYTSNMVSASLTVNKGTLALSESIDGLVQNKTALTTQNVRLDVNTTGSGVNDITVNLYVNNVLRASGIGSATLSSTFPVGIYNISGNSTSGQNWTSASVSNLVLTVVALNLYNFTYNYTTQGSVVAQIVNSGLDALSNISGNLGILAIVITISLLVAILVTYVGFELFGRGQIGAWIYIRSTPQFGQRL